MRSERCLLSWASLSLLSWGPREAESCSRSDRPGKAAPPGGGEGEGVRRGWVRGPYRRGWVLDKLSQGFRRG